MIQTVLAILTIVAALGYLGYRAYLIWWAKPDKGCDKCAVNKPMASSKK